MSERVFDFGDDREKIFPAEDKGLEEQGQKGLEEQVQENDEVAHLEYSTFGSPPSEEEEGGAQEENSQEETETIVILAGRNLICVPKPVRDVSGVTLVDISYNSLTLLNGIHQYHRVEELILDNNNISQLCLPPLPTLKSLSVNNNNLHDLRRTLNNLAISVPQLTYLSLLCNPLCPNELMSGDEDDYQMYRFSVLTSLKSLKFLDSRPVTPRERADSQKHMQFSDVIRPTARNFKETTSIMFKGTPLRAAKTPATSTSKRLTVASKRVAKYNGKNSEGNRFIGDNQL